MLALRLLSIVAAAASAASPDAERLARQGRLPEAAAAAAAAVAADPTDVASGELYVDLLRTLGMNPRAVTEARARVDQHPNDPDAWYLLGRASPDPTGSRAAYEQALRLNPDHARAQMGLGSLHEAQNELTAAHDAYSRAVATDPSLGEAWIGLVRLAQNGDRPAEARALAEQGVRAVPDEPGLALLLAGLAPEQSIAVLQVALARVPDDPALCEALAERELVMGMSTDALMLAHRALDVDPSAQGALRVELYARELAEHRLDDAGLKALLAIRASEGADPVGALPKYTDLVQRYPKSALVLLGRAALSERQKDRVSSLKDLDAAVEVDPTNVEAAGAAGIALLDANRPGEAEPLLAQASLARPWDASLAIGRWKALITIGRKADALAAIEPSAKLLRFDPGVQAAYAGSLADAGRAEEGYRVLKSTLLLVPDPRLVAAFVQIAPLAGHPDEAATLLEQIVARNPNPALAEAARRLRAQAGPGASP